MKDGTACPAFFSAVTAEISKVCVMVTVPVSRQKHLQAFEKI